MINAINHADYLCLLELKQIAHTQFFDPVTDSTTILKGYFAYKNQIRVLHDRIIFSGAALSYAATALPAKKKRSLELELGLLDQQGRVLSVHTLDVQDYHLQADQLSIEFNGGSDMQQAKAIRRDIDFMLRLKHGHIQAGGWKKLSSKGKRQWLDWAYSLHPYHSKESLTKAIQLEGSDIKCLDDFLCCMGEQVNGRLGYFGKNISALSDCMDGDPCWGAQKPLTVVWQNYSLSQQQFKVRGQSEKLQWILDILQQQSRLTLIN